MLKPSESFKTTSKSESKNIMLTPEIEKKLENMSIDLLFKTVVYYEKYKYDISVRNKAEEILKRRGVLIETKIEEINPAEKSIKILVYSLGLLLAIGLVYLKYNIPPFYYPLFSILSATIWLLSYYINKKH